MVVKQNRTQTRKAAHVEPIYFVALEAGALVTNTQADGNKVGADGFPVQYTQRINLTTGACTCRCQGFQESIAYRAQRDGITPTITNGRVCKHIRKAADSGREWGYLDTQAPVAQTAKVEAPGFDYVAFFEGA